MSLVAKDILEEARDFAPLGSEKVPDKPLLRALARGERIIYELVSHIDDTALAKTETFTEQEVSDAISNKTALVLPNYYNVLGGAVKYAADNSANLTLLPATHQSTQSYPVPSAVLIGQELRIVDSSGWDDAEGLDVFYTPVPVAPTTLIAELSLPDFSRDYLVLYVATTILRALGILEDVAYTQLTQAQQSLVENLTHQDMSTTWRVRT